MSEATQAIATPSKAKKPAKSASASKKPKAVSSHPPVAEMVLASITNLKERSGSSSQAIKKYIAANYKVEVERLQPFIKKYLKSAVVNGVLTQTKGKGANGSFKIANNSSNPKKTSVKKTVKKATNPKKTTKTVKKTETTASAGEVKTPKKSVKTPKKAVKKAKTPKPKKAKVEKKAKTPKTGKSPKKVKQTKPKPAKKTTKKAPAAKKSPKKA